MTPRDRVLTALECRQPDRVPYCEVHISERIARTLLGEASPQGVGGSLERQALSVDQEKALSRLLHRDNISYMLRAPVYADTVIGSGGQRFCGQGQIKIGDDLDRFPLPDPTDEELYRPLAEFADRKEDYALFLVGRLGYFPTVLSLGMEEFCIGIYENRPYVERLLDRYCDWMVEVTKRVCQLDIDVLVTTDDMAYKTGPLIDPKLFEELVMPRFRRIARQVTKPWIHHSDGNIVPILDAMLSLGINGIHPNEKGAMDIRWMKANYGRRVCLLGNVDLNLLGQATPERVRREVAELIRDVGPGGGYIVTSGNSVTDYCKLENVVAMAEAVQEFGAYERIG